jgi:dolichyl-phosphate beta-glucosyltransferase
MRKLSSKLFTIFISRYVVTGVNDSQCGLKGFKASVANDLFSKQQVNGFAFDVEILYLCYKYELEIKRVSVKFQGNDISTINLFQSSFQMLWDVLGLPIRYHLLKKY